MLLQTTLTALTLLGAASARIVGIAAPSIIAPNSTFQITILTENYIQSVQDISAAFGLTKTPYPGTLGNLLTSTYLGPAQSNILTNISVNVTLPSWATPATGYTLTAAITSLYGASSSVVETLYTLPGIIISPPSTSATLISTTDGVGLCDANSVTTSSTTPTSSTTLTSSTSSTKPTSTLTTSTTSVTSTASVSPTASSSANLTNFPYLIQGVNAGLNALIQEILNSDFAGAQANYDSLAPYFDQFLDVATSGASCADAGTGDDLTLNEAISTVQTIQGTLNILLQDVRNSDASAATTAACDAIALYFNSGLYEYVYDV